MRLVGWLLNLVYVGLLTAASPLVLWRMLRHGRYRIGWRERLFGWLPPSPDDGRETLWLHAVSVGEVLLLRPLVARLRSQHPGLRIVITTATDSGFAVAREQYQDCVVTWMPLDFTWAVRTALRRLRPTVCGLVELELWPNLLMAARSAEVPIVLVNGRLSERSWRGYRRLRPLVSRLLSGIARIGVQNATYAARFLDLGAEKSAVVVTGSLKFDGCHTDRENIATMAVRESLSISDGERVFVAGSTGPGEEAIVLEAWERAKLLYPDLRLILVPRHRERFEEVARLIESRGHRLRRRSETIVTPARRADGRTAGDGAAPPVLLVDTIGELSAVWGVADFAFVGGSLFPGRGGQSMIEPAGYAAAVMFGPHTANFQAVVEQFTAANAVRVVSDAAAMTRCLEGWLSARESALELGSRARELVLSQQGATERTLAALESVLAQRAGLSWTEAMGRPESSRAA
ncbi:MAG: 3-deoxy-D-manno-octulosonic acid transferase [Planctomycetaceae bacterium]